MKWFAPPRVCMLIQDCPALRGRWVEFRRSIAAPFAPVSTHVAHGCRSRARRCKPSLRCPPRCRAIDWRAARGGVTLPNSGRSGGEPHSVVQRSEGRDHICCAQAARARKSDSCILDHHRPPAGPLCWTERLRLDQASSRDHGQAGAWRQWQQSSDGDAGAAACRRGCGAPQCKHFSMGRLRL